jgi:competence protein ComEA
LAGFKVFSAAAAGEPGRYISCHAKDHDFMEPAQAPTLTPSPQTGVTAAVPNRLAAPLAVPAPPELSGRLLPSEPQDASAEPPPATNPVVQRPVAAASDSVAVAPERSPLLAAWPRSALVTTASLLGLVAALLVWHCLSATGAGARPTDLERRGEIAYRVDLNHAPVAELEQLPGVGPKRAERIDAYRRTHGPFRSVEELRKVPGFGPVMQERLRDLVRVNPPQREPERAAPPPAPAPPKKRPGLGKKEVALQGAVIDVNRASLQELQRLPGIGPKMSQRIADERARGRFKTVDELRRVSGIGPKILEKLRPYVTVGDNAQVTAAEGN